jgi:competence protein ComEA
MARVLGACRQSVWLPVVAKASTVIAGMIGLAALGGLSTLHGSGQEISTERSPSRAGAIDGLWLAPTEPVASGSASPTPTPTLASASTPQTVASASAGDGGARRDERPPPGVTADGRVILNTASASELTRLPGVGQKRAEAIVKLRERLGRFRRATDLLRVRGIGVRSLKKMLPHLVLDPPEPSSPGEGHEPEGPGVSK